MTDRKWERRRCPICNRAVRIIDGKYDLHLRPRPSIIDGTSVCPMGGCAREKR